ncbi:MAG: hypothetical protein KDA71_23475, partial [Planctomycetales bacterium]|nr:hypothetical protein [Planctomycetales bacterium]
GYKGSANFRIYCEWDGTATEPLWADTFLPACGYVKTTNTFNPLTEAPGSNVKTLTIGLWREPYFLSLAGAMGSAKIKFLAGRPVFIDFAFQGVWQAVVDDDPPSITYPNTTKARYGGASGAAVYDSVSMCLASAVVDLGNEIYVRECPSKDAGYIAAHIVDRRPIITVDPESVAEATQARWAKLLDSSEAELSFVAKGAAGTSSDATFGVTMPKAQIVKNTLAERGKIATDAIEFQANKNGSTNDRALAINFVPKVDS